MENFKKFIDFDFNIENNGWANPLDLKHLKNCIKAMNKCFDKEQNSFVDLVYYIYELNGLFTDYNRIAFGRVYTKSNKEYTFDDIMQGFGFDRTQVCRFIKTYDKFMVIGNNKPQLVSYISDFSKSKIFELLQVDEKQLQKDISNGVLRSDMSVKQIREYVKNYKALEKQNKKMSEEPKEQEEVEKEIEEEIPPAYNPKQHYDFSYFEKQSKAQLLNIVWELQKEYERITKKNTNTNPKIKCIMV